MCSKRHTCCSPFPRPHHSIIVLPWGVIDKSMESLGTVLVIDGSWVSDNRRGSSSAGAIPIRHGRGNDSTSPRVRVPSRWYRGCCSGVSTADLLGVRSPFCVCAFWLRVRRRDSPPHPSLLKRAPDASPATIASGYICTGGPPLQWEWTPCPHSCRRLDRRHLLHANYSVVSQYFPFILFFFWD